MDFFKPQSPILVAVFIFISACFLSWYINGPFFAVGMDEGIYLTGGQKLASGQMIYRDFFAFVGPITYWVQAILFRLFGNELQHLRLSTAAGVGGIVVSLYLMGRRFVGNGFGLSVALLWLGIFLDLPNRMEINHRWVSLGLFSLSISFALVRFNLNSGLSVISGVLAGVAACSTPVFAVSGAILGCYFLKVSRSIGFAFFSGLFCAATVVLGITFLRGEFDGFMQGLMWASQHYMQANQYSFGYLPKAAIARYFLQVQLGSFSIPLALLAASGYWLWRRDHRIELPLIACLALLPTAFPKCDSYSLFFISGPYFCLLLGVLYLQFPLSIRPLLEGLSLAIFAFFLLSAFALRENLTLIQTRAGLLRGDASSALDMERLELAIPPRSSIFVYPYLSGLYILLDSINNAKHAYLQPGMMGEADETQALADLLANPPEYVFWQVLPDEAVRRLWPSSNPEKHRFRKIESWIYEHFNPGLILTESRTPGQVWVRKQSTR